MNTERDYTARLENLSNARWKQALRVQAPYRWHIRHIVEGVVLDVGCGIGRNLDHLDGRGVGVDTNSYSVEVARLKGFTAYTSDEFPSSPDAKREGYSSLLFAHVLEHMDLGAASDLIANYLSYLRAGGRVIIIVPQEAGFKTDPTHIAPVNLADITHMEAAHGLVRERDYSFPFPRFAGQVFPHNETVAISRKP